MGLYTKQDERRRGRGFGEISTSLDGPEAAVAEGFDDGVVLDELLRVGVGELDGAAPAEEVFRRSDGGPELGVDGVAPVRGQARDGTDVYVLEDARLVEEEGLDAARGAKRGWGFVREGVEGLGGDRRVDVGDDLVQADGLVGDRDPVAAAAMSSRSNFDEADVCRLRIMFAFHVES